MYIRNWRGRIVFFDTEKINSEKEYYSKLWKIKYNVNINVGGKIAQLGSRLIDAVGKKMADYFFGRFADLVSPVKKSSNLVDKPFVEKRVEELKSNFLNKYIYSAIIILVLLWI